MIMPGVYVADQGCSISKKGDRLYVYKGINLLRWFHTKDISQLIVVGNVAISSPALTYLLKHKIDTVFLSYYGKYKGRLVGEFGKNVELRVNQYHYFSDIANREQLASAYVAGKIQNMQTHLQKRMKRNKHPLLWAPYLQNQAILEKIRATYISMQVIRGYEGITAKNYFSAFPAMIFQTEFKFSGRNRRPPKDEVNALLSLGYTLLMNQVMAAANIVGLDPFIGALHDLSYGRQSLVLDLMEEFRPLVDNLVISLINRKEIRMEHFAYNLIPDEESTAEDIDADTKLLPVSLKPDGMKILITSFAKLVNSRFTLKNPEGDWTLKDIFELQARRLVKQIQGSDQYAPFMWN